MSDFPSLHARSEYRLANKGTAHMGKSSSVDVEGRRRAAVVLRGFIEGRLTNDELDERYPGASPDRALHAIYHKTWPFQDDLRTYRLQGPTTLSPEERTLFERCVLFLETDLRYEWPSPWQRVWRWRMRASREQGAPGVWPFFRERDWKHAAERTTPKG
jgi:hypothetical protein